MHKASGPACAFVGPTRDPKGPGTTFIPCGTGKVEGAAIVANRIGPRPQGVTAQRWSAQSRR